MATYGEGDPTDNAQDFYDWLQENDDEDLSGLNYTVSVGLRLCCTGMKNVSHHHYTWLQCVILCTYGGNFFVLSVMFSASQNNRVCNASITTPVSFFFYPHFDCKFCLYRYLPWGTRPMNTTMQWEYMSINGWKNLGPNVSLTSV